MKYFKLFLLLLICLASSKTFSYEHSSEFLDKNVCKIYVAEKDLLFNDNQIYLSTNEEFETLDGIYCDAKGLFIIIDQKRARSRLGQTIGEQLESNTCPNGHFIYHHRYDGGCGGCANWWCPFRCKCSSPWN